MVNFVDFRADESGAVTVDWVVLTAALVGLGLAVMAVVSGGVENLSEETAEDLAAVEVGEWAFGTPSGTVAFSGSTWQDYFNIGNTAAPGNSGATYAIAIQAAADDAPDGFNYTTPLVDNDSGNVVYTSDDGNSYAIGGDVIAVDDYSGTLITL